MILELFYGSGDSSFLNDAYHGEGTTLYRLPVFQPQSSQLCLSVTFLTRLKTSHIQCFNTEATSMMFDAQCVTCINMAIECVQILLN